MSVLIHLQDLEQAQAPPDDSPSPPFRPLPKVYKLLTPLLTIFVLFVHGYHPYSDDGGLYVTGVKHLLNPHLYPVYTPFVVEHLRFSFFAPLVAFVVQATHLPLAVDLLALYLVSTWLTLYAAWLLAVQITASTAGRIGAVTLFACWITLPVAGTSLYLTDPFLTARSFSTPLTLLALVFTLRRRPLLCCLALLAAALLHPLMAAYALAAVLLLLASGLHNRRRRWTAYASMLGAAVLVAAALQFLAPSESPDYLQIALTRYYWFPFWWHWYEQIGLAAPILILAALLCRRAQLPVWPAIIRSALALAVICLVVALCFSRVHLTTHFVARLQPLRCFQIVYELFVLLLGAWLGETILRTSASRWVTLLVTMGGLMFYVQRVTYPASRHIELPWNHPDNPWVQSFLWVRGHTPIDAVFALDAQYINIDGEDAQSFRAIAERSALPDYSKDGGEASITPPLTSSWTRASHAQIQLDAQSDAHRLAILKPLGASWIILRSGTQTAFSCPYSNAAVKVCRLP